MGNDTTIREAIKSIALNKVASNAEYSDKLRIVHGFVTAYNKDEGKSGTIDFSSMDGTVIIRDISLSSIPGLEKGIIQEPTIGSDVTVLWKVGTGDATIMSMSHVDNHTVNATNSVTVGVTEETPDDPAVCFISVLLTSTFELPTSETILSFDTVCVDEPSESVTVEVMASFV